MLPGPSGYMSLKFGKWALFKETTPVLLRDALNNFAGARAAGTAPNNYAALFATEATWIQVDYWMDATAFCAAVFYTD